eukprot:5225721-Amphidinium_carterae.1
MLALVLCVSPQAATRDITVQIFFFNAGYILTGFFDQRPVEACSSHLTLFQCFHLPVHRKGTRRFCFAQRGLDRFKLKSVVSEAQLANFNCNLTANIRMTHHFYGMLLAKQLR